MLDMLDRRSRVGVAEVRGTRTAPLLNMTGMEEEVLWYGAAYPFLYRAACA